MTWTSIATQFVLTVGASLAERLASALSARIKQEPETASPVDIAIATKSAVSADREGKIASERGKTERRCNHCGLRSEWLARDGLCLRCEHLRASQKPSECAHPGMTIRQFGGGYIAGCEKCGLSTWGETQKHAEDMLSQMRAMRDAKPRRLGDYGPGGE